MAIDKRVQSLYDALKGEGADVGTPEEFNEWFFKPGEEGYKNRKYTWDTFHNAGADVGESYEEFADWLNLQPVRKPSAQAQQVIGGAVGAVAGGKTPEAAADNTLATGNTGTAPATTGAASTYGAMASDYKKYKGEKAAAEAAQQKAIEQAQRMAEVQNAQAAGKAAVPGGQQTVQTLPKGQMVQNQGTGQGAPQGNMGGGNKATPVIEMGVPQGGTAVQQNDPLAPLMPKWLPTSRTIAYAPIFKTGGVEYKTNLDAFIREAVDKGYKRSKNYGDLSVNQLKAERQNLLSGTGSSGDRLQDAVNLSVIDFELAAKSLGYGNWEEMKSNIGVAHYEMFKNRVTKEYLDEYGKGGAVTGPSYNPILTHGWEKMVKFINDTQAKGENVTPEEVISYIMSDPEVANRYSAWTLARAKAGKSESWGKKYKEGIEDVIRMLEAGRNLYATVPDEKDEMAKYATGELDRMDADVDKGLDAANERYEQWRKGGAFGLGDTDPYQQYMNATGDIDIELFSSAKHLNAQTRTLVDEAMKGGGFVNSSIRGLVNGLFSKDTWDFGVGEMIDAGHMKVTIDKVLNNPNAKLTPGEQALMDAVAAKTVFGSFFGKYLPSGYKAGETTAQAIPFIIEMATGIGETTQGLTKAAAKYTARQLSKYGTKFLERIGLKNVIETALKALSKRGGRVIEKLSTSKLGRVVTKAAESKLGRGVQNVIETGISLGKGAVKSAVGGVGYAATTGSIKTIGGGINRTIGTPVVTRNAKTGKLEVTGQMGAEKPFMAFMKEFGAQVGEYGSEMFGPYLERLTGGLKAWGRELGIKAADKMGIGNLVREIGANINENDMMRILNDFKKMGHYDGTFNEYLEEVANNIYNAALIKDMNWGTGEHGVFNIGDNVDTYLSCLYMSGLFGIPAAVSYRTPKYRAKQDINTMDRVGQRTFSLGKHGKDWNSISEMIRNGDDEKVKELMVNIARSKKYNEQERRAAINLAAAVYKHRGMEAGEKKTKQTPTEGAMKELYGRGYSIENVRGLSDARAAHQAAQRAAQWIPPEVMQMIEEEPAYVYDWVAGNPAWSEQEKQQLFDYINTKVQLEGAEQRMKDGTLAAEEEAHNTVDLRTNKQKEDGTGGDNMVHPVTLKDGRTVFVTGGNVSADSNGKVTSDTDDIIVVDEDNKTSMINVKDIKSVEDVQNPDDLKQTASTAIREQAGEEEMEADAEAGVDPGTDDAAAMGDGTGADMGGNEGDGADMGTDAVVGDEVNTDTLLDTMGVTDEDQRQQLSELWAQNPPTNATDVLNDMMGVTDPEQRESNNNYWLQHPESFVSQWRYHMGDVSSTDVNGVIEAMNTRGTENVEGGTTASQPQPQPQQGDVAMASQQTGQTGATPQATAQGQPAQPAQQGAAATPGEYNVGDVVSVNVDGQQVTGEVYHGVNDDGTIGVQFDAPVNGQMDVELTPAQLDEMMQPAPASAAPAPQSGTTPGVPQTAQALAPEAQQPQQQGEAAAQPGGIVSDNNTPIPVVDGRTDYSAATPERAHHNIYNERGLSKDRADKVVGAAIAKREAEAAAANEAVAKARRALEQHQAKDIDIDNIDADMAEEQRLADALRDAEAQAQQAQNAVDYWKKVKEIENNSGEAAAPAAERPDEGNRPVASTSTSEEESGEREEEPATADQRIEELLYERLTERAEELAESCGLPVQVARSLDDLSDSHRRQVEKQHAEGKYVNGFYDPKTKQIVLFMPDIAANGGMRRLERTFLHEGVAHGGLRALFENAQNGIQTFDELCDQVWEMMPVAAQASMMNYIGVQKPEDMTQEKKRIAADEYMAHLAEWGVEQSVKTRIINAIKNALRKIGIKMRLNNNDIVSLLAASRRNLTEMDKVGINSAISEALDNDGEGDGEGVRMSTTAIFEGAGLEVSRDATDNEGKPTKEPLTDSKGNLVARIGDKEYSVDNPVTVADLKEGDKDKKERTVLQMLINDAIALKNITEKQADKIYQNYADLLNMYLYTGSAELGGPDAVKENWEWLGDSVFRTIAANGDAQYSYSMDIIRVCKKNEAVIKAMSALQLREGRGATPSEIVELYRETHEDGYQVPCPVCYVFTRYIRNGKYASAAIKGMEKWGDHLPGGSDVWSVDQWLDALDKIQRETNPDYKPDGKNKMEGEELEKAKRFKKQLDQANKITVAYEKRVNALSYLLTTDDAIKAGTIKNKVLELTPERRASIEKELEIINEQYQHAVEIIAHQALSNWIKTHAIEEKEGKWQMREDARKPEDIDDYKRNALDLRLTSNTIVNYPAIQRLRKSGGSAAGKEISFASDNRLGEVVSGLGINKTNLSGYKNKYEEALNATGRARNKARNEARKRFKDATVYALMQTLRGGQRMWSWSDNIERLSPDIAINIMQLQLLGGAMQTYSKQLEGIKLAAQMGGYVNGSLMAKDNGYQEVTDKDVEERDGKLWLNHDITDEVEEYPVGGGEPKPRKRIVAANGSYVYQAEDGKKYVLIYDDVVGVDPFGNELHGKGKKKGLFKLNQEYDRAGNILVGMNDLHVRAAMADPKVFFIIPWHASGANNHILNQMLNILEQTMTDRLDYTAMQEEKNMLERNKNTKELPEVNQRLRDLWEEGRQWAEQNKWKSGMEVDSNGDVITESQYMYRQLRAQIFNGNIFEAMPSEEQYRAAVEVVNSMQATMDELNARNEQWKAKSPEYKKSPEGKAEKKAIERDKAKAKKRYNPAVHTIELHDGLIDWRDSSQHEGDAEWQVQHPKRINVEEARRMIENDEFLSQVLKRVEPIGHMTNGDNTYIYPYEYWQEADKKGNPADIKDADINGKRYVEYCRRMGYKPKFSGRWGDKVTEENMNDGNFVHDPGYWKLLIDRRMYDRKGKYQWLDPVESENFEPDLVNPLKTGEEFNITQVADDKDAEDIAERVYNNMAERDGGVAKVDYSKPLDKIMDEYDAALAAGVQANVKLTEAEEDALEDMEEAMAEEDSEVMFSSTLVDENSEEEIEAMHDTIDSWMTQENLNKAIQSMDGIDEEDKNARRQAVLDYFDAIDPEIHIVNYIPQRFLNYIWGETEDNRIHSSMGYLIEHAVNRHPQMEQAWYSELSEYFSNPDEIKESYGINRSSGKMQRSVYFIKDMGSHYSAIVVKLEQDDNGASGINYKSFYGHHPKDSKKGRKFLKKELLLWDKDNGENNEIITVQQELPDGGHATFKTHKDNEINANEAGAKKINDSSLMGGGTIIGATASAVSGRYRISPPNELSLQDGKGTTKNETTKENSEKNAEKAEKSSKTTDNGGGVLMSSSAMDSEYMAAVEADDMEKAGELVQRAAETAMPDTKVVDEDGKPMVVYHASRHGDKFTVFDTSPERNGMNYGSHFGTRKAAEDIANGEPYAETYQVYLNITNPMEVVDYFADDNAWWANLLVKLVDENNIDDPQVNAVIDRMREIWPWLDGTEESFDENEDQRWNSPFMLNDPPRLVETVRDVVEHLGYDGFVYENLMEDVGNESYVAFRPEQIKSAEPVTRDENGDVIPLSERFDFGNKDIRWSVSNYSLGAPYQGTKGRIANQIVDDLPSGERFVDLFAGGGAVTHAAILSGKYGSYHMNDINPVGQELFLQGVRGEWEDYDRTNMTPEEFNEIKGTPESLPWSYNGLGRNLVKGGRPDYINRMKRLGQLKQYADDITSTNEDYRDVEIRPGDVVYADIPYEKTDTRGYGKGRRFDKKAFCEWAQAQDFPIFVSEYTMPEGWVEIDAIEVGAMRRNDKRTEKLWLQEKFADEYEPTARNTEQEAEVDGVPAYEANNLRFSVLDPERDADLIADLDGQEYVTVYRTMAKVNGEYYPPMDSRDHDNPEKLRNPEKLGQYTQSEERPDLAYAEEYIDKKTGEKKTRWKFNLKKSNGKSVDGVAYNPYMHTSDSALNDQFSEAQDRDDLVVVECRVPVSELDPNSYHAEKALDPVGWKPWKAGPIVSKMTGKRNLLLSRWVKPVKELSWSEVADMVSKQLGDQFDVLPSNTFSKGLRAELEKRGYKFIETDNKGIIKSGLYKGVTWSDRYYDIHPELDKRSNKKQKRAKVAEAKARNAEAGEDSEVMFSTSDGREEIAIYINDGHTADGKVVDFANAILDGRKKGETRNHNRLTRKWVGIAKDGQVIGRVKLGAPKLITKESPEYKDTLIEGTEYDIADGESKYYYPVEAVEDMRDNPRPIIRNGNYGMYEAMPRNTEQQPEADGGLRFSTSEGVAALKDDERVYNDLLGKVFSGVSVETRRGIVGDAMENRGNDFGAATEAWLMGLAEDEYFAMVPEEDWRAVKNALGNALRENGVEGTMTDNEARYVLWKAGQIEDGVFSMAEDRVKQDELLNGARAPQYTDNNQSQPLFSTTPMDKAIARDEYERMMRKGRMQWVEALQDSMLGLKKLMQSILGDEWTMIEDVPMNENAYIAENLMSSVGAVEQAAYHRDFFKPLEEEISKLCQGGRKERERKREELTNYLLAKHGLERNQVLAERDAQETAEAGGDYLQAYAENREKDYSGLTELTEKDDVHAAEAEAQQMVNDYEAQHDVTELWNKINAATKATLDKQLQSGLLSRDAYDKISDMFEYYVPLRGWKDTTSDEVYGYLTCNDGPFLGGSIEKRAEGRTTVADDPIANIAKLADDSIRTGNRNLMKQRFLTFVLNHPSDAVSVSELWLTYDDVTNEWKPIFAKIPKDATAAKVEQIVKQFEADMAQLAQQEPDKYKRGREAASIPYKVIPGNEREHQVLVKRNGRTYVLTINGNPRAAQALNGVTNPDVKTAGHVSAAINWFESVGRYLSAVSTTYNPAFIVSNFMRDSIYTNNMVWVKEKPNYAVRFNYNFFRTNPGRMRRLLGKWEKGTLDTNKPMEKMFKEFLEHGGETGYAMAQELDDYKKKIASELSTMNGKNFHKKVGRAILEQYDLLGRAVENCARFAAFVTSREMGRSADRAAYDAKEISVNFNKKGSGGKTYKIAGQTKLGNIGAFVGGWARSLYIFWNAGMQGLTNIGRAEKRHPGKFIWGLFSKTFAMGFFAPMLAAAMGAGDGDDDDKNAYYNLPEYVRRSNLCIYIGGLSDKVKGTWLEPYVNGLYLTIPLPVEFRAIYGMGELTYGVFSGNEHYSPGELTFQYLSQFSQILPLDMLEGGGGWHAFVPSPVKPIVEVGTNTSWSGMPVYKEDKYDGEEYDPSFKKAFSNTSGWMVDLSEWSNRMSGGTDATKGWADWNPAKVEYLLKGYMGGVYSFSANVANAGQTFFGDRPFEWKNIPFANRVLKQGDERQEAKKLNSEYYRYKEEAAKVEHDLKGLQEKENPNVYDYAKKIDILNNSKAYRHYVIFKDMDELVSDYKKTKEKSTDPDAIKDYEAMELNAKREMVNMINASDKGEPVNSTAARGKVLLNILDNASDTVLLKEARGDMYNLYGAVDRVSNSKSKTTQRYIKLAKGKDIAEDAQLQKKMSNANKLGKKDLYEAYGRAKGELDKIKNGVHNKSKTVLGLGEGDIKSDMAIMERYGKRRAEILKMSEAEILKNFPKGEKGKKKKK